MAGADFATVDEAVTAMAQSMERAASRHSAARQREVLRLCVTPMIERIRTEGVRALAEGRSWSDECEGLYVIMNLRRHGGRPDL
ncbi:hypothetical protein AB0C59_25945 [Streptomyces sp. NPDC048664]|uniref:hypothetical protein n=1 Tax=Streptomyces sp. NPDC048664 TaxID=3154505 RepID=UPI00342EC42E